MRLIVISPVKGTKKLVLLLLIILFLTVAYFINSTKIPVAATASPVYQGSSKEKKIALTFNVVWGEEYIPQILEILKENKTAATFFIGGQWAEDFPDLVREVVNSGHEVGNHGYSHPHPDRISRSANFEQIKRTEEVLNIITGVKTNLFAPPYGERGDNVLKAAEEAGYTTILWSIDTIDWQRPNPTVIFRRVADKAHNGAIVLMHPTAPTVHALPLIVADLKKRGYEIVRVSALVDGLNKEK